MQNSRHLSTNINDVYVVILYRPTLVLDYIAHKRFFLLLAIYAAGCLNVHGQ